MYSAISVIVSYWTLFEGAPFIRNALSKLRRGFQRKFSANFSTDEIQEAIPRLVQRLNEHPSSIKNELNNVSGGFAYGLRDSH